MSSAEEPRPGQIKVNVNNLYREESYSDLRVATIRQLSPVKPDGSPDPSREPLFIGQAHVMTQAGPVPLEVPIEAKTLAQALEKFPEAVQAGVAEMVEQVREMQRREASRIVVPTAMPGGKIQLG